MVADVTTPWGPVDRAMADLDPESTVALLAAAADSPFCGHRIPSLMALWARAVSEPSHGRRPATESDLSRLLRAARRSSPGVLEFEDTWMNDPRFVVRFAHLDRRFAVHPGPFNHPIEVLRSVQHLGAVLDDLVYERHGFGISDLLWLGLDYMDRRLSVLRPSWPDGPHPGHGDRRREESLTKRVSRIARTPASVTPMEILKSATCEGVHVSVDESPDPPRATAALAWVTHPGKSCLDAWAEAVQHLGGMLVAEGPGLTASVPAAFVLGEIAFAAAALCAEFADQPGPIDRMQRATHHRLMSWLSGGLDVGAANDWSADIPDPYDLTVVPVGRLHAFALAVASGLDQAALETDINRVTAGLDEFHGDRLVDAGAAFDSGGALIRVVLYGGPLRMQPAVQPGTVRLHVDELFNFQFESGQTEAGRTLGRSFLWQFLDELATMPGIGQILTTDLDDVWRHWLRRGVLNDGGMVDIALALDPVPDERRWDLAAMWEPYDQVLFDAGLPPSWAWPGAHVEEGDRGATVGAQGTALMVSVRPRLVVVAQLQSVAVGGQVEPALLLGVGDGIRSDLGSDPALADAFDMESGMPLVLTIRLEDRASPRGDRQGGVAVQTSSAARHQLDVRLTSRWLELVASSPDLAHLALGRAVLRGLGRLKRLRNAPALIRAWAEQPPVLLLHQEAVGLIAPKAGRVSLPISPATEGRSRRALARAVVRQGVESGQYSGQAARRVALNQLAPAARSAIDLATEAWSADAVLSIARHLNDAHAERVRWNKETELGLSAPWASRRQKTALRASDPVELTRALELLLELQFARSTWGTIAPDDVDIAEAVDLAAQMLRIGLSISASSSLHSVSLTIDAIGRSKLSAVPPEESGLIDIQAFARAARADQLRMRLALPPVAVLSLDGGPEDEAFQRFETFAPQGSLLKVDALLREALGTGLDGFMAVLGTAVSWSGSTDGVTTATLTELSTAASQWSGLPANEISRAIDRLVLRAAQLRGDDIEFWEQENREFRIANRPLLELPSGRLLIIPRRLEATQTVYGNYLADGRWPVPPSEMPARLRDGLVEFRKVANRELEREALEVAAVLGEFRVGNLTPAKAERAGVRLRGEIDLLVADPIRRRIWVCEVKDLSAAFSPSTLARRVHKFVRQHGYVDRLLRATTDVRRGIDGVCDILGLQRSDESWEVLPLIVTRRVEPAAFAHPPVVPFVVIRDLAGTLQADQPPFPGHVAVGDTLIAVGPSKRVT